MTKYAPVTRNIISAQEVREKAQRLKEEHNAYYGQCWTRKIANKLFHANPPRPVLFYKGKVDQVTAEDVASYMHALTVDGVYTVHEGEDGPYIEAIGLAPCGR